jgi:hypothetical protein
MAENVEAWTLLSLALATILIRISVRWKLVGPANFQLDDYLMLLAGVCCLFHPVDHLFLSLISSSFHRSSSPSIQLRLTLLGPSSMAWRIVIWRLNIEHPLAQIQKSGQIEFLDRRFKWLSGRYTWLFSGWSSLPWRSSIPDWRLASNTSLPESVSRISSWLWHILQLNYQFYYRASPSIPSGRLILTPGVSI